MAPDALTLLRQDHREVEGLFSEYEQAREAGAPPGRKRELVDKMIEELSKHSGIEEQVFYPAVRLAVPEGPELAEGLLHDHQEVKETLSTLESLDPSTPEFDRQVEGLIKDVKEHVEEEEGEVFPKIEASLGAEALEKMGETMERAKRLAPTRPHPKAPSRPPANLVAGPAAGVLDRAKGGGGSGKRAAVVPFGATLAGLFALRRIRRNRAA